MDFDGFAAQKTICSLKWNSSWYTSAIISTKQGWLPTRIAAIHWGAGIELAHVGTIFAWGRYETMRHPWKHLETVFTKNMHEVDMYHHSSARRQHWMPPTWTLRGAPSYACCLISPMNYGLNMFEISSINPTAINSSQISSWNQPTYELWIVNPI